MCATRTGRQPGPVATSTAIAMPAPNQHANAGSHRFSGAASFVSVSLQASQTSPNSISAPSAASTRPGRQRSPVTLASRPTTNGSAT